MNASSIFDIDPYLTILQIQWNENPLVVFQPAKLTEAFKYFLQGMGYSKYP